MKRFLFTLTFSCIVFLWSYNQDLKFTVFCKNESNSIDGKGASLEPMEVVSIDSYNQTQVVKIVFDTRHQAYRQYQAKVFGRDSFSKLMQMYLIDTVNLFRWKNENELFVLMKKKSDNSFLIIPDVNHNGSFSDDSIYTSSSPSNNELVFNYRMQFWYGQRFIRNFEIVLLPNASQLPKKFPNAVFNTWGGTKKITSGYLKLGLDSFLLHLFLPGKSVYYTKYNTRLSIGLLNENSLNIYQTAYPVFSYTDTIFLGKRILLLDKISILGDTVIFKQVGFNEAFKGVQSGAILKSVYGTHLSTGVFEDISLKRTDSKYTLLHFWGSWCGPCIANLPKLKVFAYEMNEKVEFISFPYEQQQDTVKTKKLIQQYQLNWKQMIQFRDHPFQKPDMVKQLAIEHFPTYMLIDYTGKILVRSSNLEDVIKALK